MAGNADRATYELPLAPEPPREDLAAETARDDSVPADILVRNIAMFCRFRWLVAAVLAAAGVAVSAPAVVTALGLREHTLWPWVLAAALVAANIIYIAWARRVRTSRRGAEALLWVQIVVDLLVLTGVVHFVGSLSTFVAGAYLFHIVLACIFFSRRQSLTVTALAAAMFAACVAAELRWETPSPAGAGQPPLLGGLNFGVMIAFMLVVWYLASMLSELVRRRSRELAVANRTLEQARQERMRHMLQTTHELKAPFAAIHANTQLLLKGYAGPLSEAMLPIVRKIDARSRRLANEIQDMLLLANLQSLSQRPAEAAELDLADVLAWCCQQVRDRAIERRVTVTESLQPSPARGVEEHLKMLFGNLVANAVLYSREGGQVRVSCQRDESGRAIACIEDHGIGIEPDKLPRIFDPYYRTVAAAQHNRESSGLGLAIVRDIVVMYGIRLKVSSRPGEGTTFEVTLPPAPDQPPHADEEIGAGPWRTY